MRPRGRRPHAVPPKGPGKRDELRLQLIKAAARAPPGRLIPAALPTGPEKPVVRAEAQPGLRSVGGCESLPDLGAGLGLAPGGI